MRIWTVGLLAFGMLSACHQDQDSGKPTAAEDRELNNASEMLDASPDGLTAGEDAALGNGDEAVEAENETAADGADANLD
jgi:hypothetical protein